ncbi:MAG: tetratricopeptide repeat protein [Myxococcota bacterium]|nr:tetratricopeptide repeat protein [Myxococcota bacterium]
MRGVPHVVGVLVAVLASAAAPVRAEGDGTPATSLDRIRELYERGDFAGVRRELQQQYERAADPALLFALGQVELNLGDFAAAIDYYERFIASGPADDQIALAQQAIGAARMRLTQPAPRPEQPPATTRGPRRRWQTEDSGLIGLGGTAMLVGAGLLIYAGRLGDDREGSLADYDARIDRARTMRWTGGGIVTAGALVVGVTVLRWRLRPDGALVTASVAPGPTVTSLVVTARW